MDRETMTIGILGVGHLGSALVAGLVAGDRSWKILLSPRNAERAGALAERFGLEIARDNVGLVEGSDIVIAATRPADLLDAVRGLPWRAGQTGVSVAAGGVGLAAFESAVQPATAVRALPITAAEIGESPTCLFPDDAATRAVFEQLGTVHAFDDEAAFEVASLCGVVYSVFHGILGSTVRWFESMGLPEAEGRKLCASAVGAAANMIVAHPEVDLDVMIAEFELPGSLTTSAMDVLRASGVLDNLPHAWAAALEQSRRTAVESSGRE